MNHFEHLRRIILADACLTRVLTDKVTEAELYTAVIALGHQHGIELTVAELEEVARANRREWLERWLP